nr:hypothetical protein [Tanacetum cinerariifolium]
MIMRFNEIHKFSDGTLHQIDEELDYRVKEFKVNRMNLGLNTRFWTRKYVDRSKEFMFAIQKRLKTRRIFRNLESFVGGRMKAAYYPDVGLEKMMPDQMWIEEEYKYNNAAMYVGFNSLVHSLHALSTLRCSGLKTASAAAKPCQGDSSKLYLITGRIPTVTAAGQRDVNSQPHAHTSISLSKT